VGGCADLFDAINRGQEWAMTDPERRLKRAVRLIPAGDRARYEAEWRADLVQAEGLGIGPSDVARGAMGLAVRLRLRDIGRILLGGRGVLPAAVAWLALVLMMIVAFVFGSFFVFLSALTVVMVVVAISRTGTPSRWSYWLMVFSLVTGVFSAGFVWWAAGVSIDAADNLTPEPALASWAGEALIMFVASFVGLIISAVVALTRERRR
jgi:hypothetical protein